MKKDHTRLNGSLKAIKFPQKKLNNDDEIELKRALESAAVIYDEWKLDFISTRVPLEELKLWVDKLHTRIERDIRSPKFKKIILPMLDNKIAELCAVVHQQIHSMPVDVVCGVPVDGWKDPCPWEGMGIIKRSQWDDGSVTITCPECESVLDKEHMTPKEKLK